MPTFERASSEPQDVDIKYDEEPDSSEIWSKEQFCFIFLVDRSGSMRGNRIEMAKSALRIFIRSLPPGCCFQIISFGTRTEEYKYSNRVNQYGENEMRGALRYIDEFEANFGGTDI